MLSSTDGELSIPFVLAYGHTYSIEIGEASIGSDGIMRAKSIAVIDHTEPSLFKYVLGETVA